MTYPELHFHAAVARGEHSLLVQSDDEVIGRVPKPENAHRLITCWNACRNMDDPVKEISAAIARITQLETELKFIRDGDNHLIKRLESETSELALKMKEIDRLNNLVADRDLTIGRLKNEIGQLRADALVRVCAETAPEPTIEQLAYQLLRAIVRGAK